MTKDAPGMRGIRARNESGPLRQKREDTHVATIEKAYNRNFGVRGCAFHACRSTIPPDAGPLFRVMPVQR